MNCTVSIIYVVSEWLIVQVSSTFTLPHCIVPERTIRVYLMLHDYGFDNGNSKLNLSQWVKCVVI